MKKTSKTFTYWVDIVGACNLRCPSCPRGNFKPGDVMTAMPASGLMDYELFKQIVKKIKYQEPSLNPQIHLYNWGEPLVHPEIARFVRYAVEQGIYCGISSNLNVGGTLRDVIKENPDFFRISLSGFSQEIYGQTHQRGDIERVKQNMRKLRQYIDEFGAKTYVEVNYHVYKHNANQDLLDMIAFCNELKFNISPVWAFFLPLEKNFRIVEGTESEADRKLLDLLAIHPKKGMELAMPYKDKDCPVRQRATVINFDGSVPLCCNTFERQYIVADSFLDTDYQSLQKAKYENPACKTCMDNAIHVYLAFEAGEVMDGVGNAAIAEAGSPLEIHQYEQPKVRMRTGEPVPITAKLESEMSTRKKVRGLRRVWHSVRSAGHRVAAR
jgi:pyruvate-formate lyase-activating enzyme